MAATTLSMPFTLRILRRMHVVDFATSRSSHVGTAIRGTGIALVAGVVVALLVTMFDDPAYRYLTLSVLLFGVAAGCLGFVEDTRGLSVRTRISGQFFVSLLFGAVIVAFNDISLILIPFVALLGAAYINISNFMDGLNGMSGFHGVIGGLIFVSIGLLTGHVWLSVAGAIFFAVFLAFIPWNLGRKGVFLGDSGSYLLGALHVGLACAAGTAGVPLVAAFGSTAIYVADTMTTLVVRVKKGAKLAEPHREHVYQRLNVLGWTHLQVSGTTAVFSACVSGAGLIALNGKFVTTVLAVVIILIITILYVSLPKIIRTLKIQAKNIEDGGPATNG